MQRFTPPPTLSARVRAYCRAHHLRRDARWHLSDEALAALLNEDGIQATEGMLAFDRLLAGVVATSVLAQGAEQPLMGLGIAYVLGHDERRDAFADGYGGDEASVAGGDVFPRLRWRDVALVPAGFWPQAQHVLVTAEGMVVQFWWELDQLRPLAADAPHFLEKVAFWDVTEASFGSDYQARIQASVGAAAAAAAAAPAVVEASDRVSCHWHTAGALVVQQNVSAGGDGYTLLRATTPELLGSMARAAVDAAPGVRVVCDHFNARRREAARRAVVAAGVAVG